MDSLMQIEVLDLSRNRIESIAECAFCSCSKLTHIDISSNGLLELGNMFGDRRYEKLKYLSLSHNLLQVPVNKTSPLTPAPDSFNKNFSIFRKFAKRSESFPTWSRFICLK